MAARAVTDWMGTGLQLCHFGASSISPMIYHIYSLEKNNKTFNSDRHRNSYCELCPSPGVFKKQYEMLHARNAIDQNGFLTHNLNLHTSLDYNSTLGGSHDLSIPMGFDRILHQIIYHI